MSCHGEVVTTKLSPEELAEVIRKYGPAKEPLNKYNTRSIVLRSPEEKREEWRIEKKVVKSPKEKKPKEPKAPKAPKAPKKPYVREVKKECVECGKGIYKKSKTGKCRKCLVKSTDCPECLKEGEKIAVYRGGYCAKHHTRMKRHGTLEAHPKGRKTQHVGCLIPECAGKHYGSGYCAKHNKRYVQYGDPYKFKRKVGVNEYILVDERELKKVVRDVWAGKLPSFHPGGISTRTV